MQEITEETFVVETAAPGEVVPPQTTLKPDQISFAVPQWNQKALLALLRATKVGGE